MTRLFPVPSVLRHRGLEPFLFDEHHWLLTTLDPLFLLLTLAGYDVDTVVVVQEGAPDFVMIKPRSLEVFHETDMDAATAWQEIVGTPWPAGAKGIVHFSVLPRDLFTPSLSYYDFKPIPITHPRLAVEAGPVFVNPWSIRFTAAEKGMIALVDAIHADYDAADGLREALIQGLVSAAAAFRAGAAETLVGLLPIFNPTSWQVRPITGEGERARSRRAQELTELGESMQAMYLSTSDEMAAFLREESAWASSPSMAKRLATLADEEDLRASDLEEKARRFTSGVSRHRDPSPEGIAQWIGGSDLHALSYTRLLMLAQELGALDMLLDIWARWQKRQPELKIPPGLFANVPMRSVRGQEVRSAILNGYTVWKLFPEKGVLSLRDAYDVLFDLDDGIWKALEHLASIEGNTWFDQDYPRELADSTDEALMVLLEIEEPDIHALDPHLEPLLQLLVWADEYWSRDADTGDQGVVHELIRGFLEGLGDADALVEELVTKHIVHHALLYGLTPVVVAGMVKGIYDRFAELLVTLGPWLTNPKDELDKIVDAVFAMLEAGLDKFAFGVGFSAGESIKKSLTALATAPGAIQYAFEMGKLVGPLLLDIAVQLVFEFWVFPRLASAGAVLLRDLLKAGGKLVPKGVSISFDEGKVIAYLAEGAAKEPGLVGRGPKLLDTPSKRLLPESLWDELMSFCPIGGH